jgi:uncharacterized membrane protein YqjE
MIGFWRKHFLWVELVIAVVVGVAATYWIIGRVGSRTIDTLLDHNRATVYAAFATLWGSLLGFVITAASIVLGLSGSESLAVVRGSSHYLTLWKVFTASIRALGLATLLVLIGLILDRDNRPNHVVFCLAIFGSVLATLRLIRCVWVIEKVIFLVARPQAAAAVRERR